ncbi:MAG: hypothetical protein KDC38_14330 [Planctomycetes bacterium]|nr:hypothetical protein [Planctomycetota bacterium]
MPCCKLARRSIPLVLLILCGTPLPAIDHPALIGPNLGATGTPLTSIDPATGLGTPLVSLTEPGDALWQFSVVDQFHDVWIGAKSVDFDFRFVTVDPNTGDAAVSPPFAPEPWSLQFDAVLRELIVVRPFVGTLQVGRVDPVTADFTLITVIDPGLGSPVPGRPALLDSGNHELYVFLRSGSGARFFVIVDTQSGSVTSGSPWVGEPTDYLAMNAAGGKLYGLDADGLLASINALDGTHLPLADLSGHWTPLVDPIDPDGARLYAVRREDPSDPQPMLAAVDLTDPGDATVEILGPAPTGHLLTVRSLWARDPFLRGDANSDAIIDLSDVLFTLTRLFVPGGDSAACLDSADSNDDGRIDLLDPLTTLQVLFDDSSTLQLPTECTVDESIDALDCDTYDCP